MAKKASSTSKSTSTPVRRTSTPRSRSAVSSNGPAPAVAPRIVTDADIARRAYELYCSGAPGGQLDHWLQAERELRGA